MLKIFLQSLKYLQTVITQENTFSLLNIMKTFGIHQTIFITIGFLVNGLCDSKSILRKILGIAILIALLCSSISSAVFAFQNFHASRENSIIAIYQMSATATGVLIFVSAWLNRNHLKSIFDHFQHAPYKSN